MNKFQINFNFYLYMNRITKLFINKYNIDLFRNKYIYKKNIFIQYDNYISLTKLQLNAPHINNIFIQKIDNDINNIYDININNLEIDLFDDLNKNMLDITNIFFLNKLNISNSSNILLLEHINKDLHKKIYIDDIQYTKFINQLENFQKLNYGYTIDYSDNLIQIERKKMINYINLLYDDIIHLKNK